MIVREPFAVWLTGLPASGKSSIAGALREELAACGLTVEVLESDVLRRHLTPSPTYSPEERELFYRALAYFGSRLAAHGVPVIFDATGHRRSYREFARGLIPQRSEGFDEMWFVRLAEPTEFVVEEWRDEV